MGLDGILAVVPGGILVAVPGGNLAAVLSTPVGRLTYNHVSQDYRTLEVVLEVVLEQLQAFALLRYSS